MTDTEKDTLEARIDELCAEVERLRQENQSVGIAAYELGRASLADENTKLRNEHKELQEFAARMAQALEIYSEWYNPACCQSMCVAVFKCHSEDDCKIRCPAWARLRKLGVVK